MFGFILLSGCWLYPGDRPSSDASFYRQVQAAIDPVDPARIEILVIDPLPIETARLIDPEGHATEALAIAHSRRISAEDYGIRPNVAVGVAGGSSSRVATGFGIGFPLFPGGKQVTRVIVDSRATILIPDPARYKRDWQRSKLAVELNDGVNSRRFEMLPPPPAE